LGCIFIYLYSQKLRKRLQSRFTGRQAGRFRQHAAKVGSPAAQIGVIRKLYNGNFDIKLG
jgi:hypothetical protein